MADAKPWVISVAMMVHATGRPAPIYAIAVGIHIPFDQLPVRQDQLTMRYQEATRSNQKQTNHTAAKSST